ncbi:MAG: hypothetical protein ACR2MB_11720 [Acidimicrobiales bacterium]
MDEVNALEQARQTLGLSVGDLWYRYFALGGMSSALEIDAILHGALLATAPNRDRLAVALNERFAEQGQDQPLAYAADGAGRP